MTGSFVVRHQTGRPVASKWTSNSLRSGTRDATQDLPAIRAAHPLHQGVAHKDVLATGVLREEHQLGARVEELDNSVADSQRQPFGAGDGMRMCHEMVRSDDGDRVVQNPRRFVRGIHFLA
jgi:hypothetical protein